MSDVVGNLVEGVADRETGSDLGDWETRGLRGQGRRARNARVHFDDEAFTVFGIDGELDV